LPPVPFRLSHPFAFAAALIALALAVLPAPELCGVLLARDRAADYLSWRATGFLP